MTHSRAVIYKNREYAMQRANNGEFKFPDDRMEKGEGPVETLIREVLGETGLYVEDSIEEKGEIIEIRKDIYDEHTKYICHKFGWTNLGGMIKDNRSLQLNEARIRDTVYMEKIISGKQ